MTPGRLEESAGRCCVRRKESACEIDRASCGAACYGAGEAEICELRARSCKVCGKAGSLIRRRSRLEGFSLGVGGNIFPNPL